MAYQDPQGLLTEGFAKALFNKFAPGEDYSRNRNSYLGFANRALQGEDVTVGGESLQRLLRAYQQSGQQYQYPSAAPQTPTVGALNKGNYNAMQGSLYKNALKKSQSGGFMTLTERNILSGKGRSYGPSGNQGGTPSTSQPGGEPNVPGNAQFPNVNFDNIGSSNEQVLFQDLLSQMQKIREQQAGTLGGTSLADQLKALRESELTPLSQPIQNLATLAGNIRTSIDQLPEDTARRTQDFLVTEAQRRRKEAVEREPLSRQLANTLASQNVLEGERTARMNYIQQLMGAGESDVERKLKAQQLIAGPQEDILKSAIERQLNRIDTKRTQTTGNLRQDRLAAVNSFISLQQTLMGAGLGLSPVEGEKALKEIQESKDPFAALQKYIMKASNVPAVKKALGPKGAKAPAESLKSARANLSQNLSKNPAMTRSEVKQIVQDQGWNPSDFQDIIDRAKPNPWL